MNNNYSQRHQIREISNEIQAPPLRKWELIDLILKPGSGHWEGLDDLALTMTWKKREAYLDPGANPLCEGGLFICGGRDSDALPVRGTGTSEYIGPGIVSERWGLTLKSGIENGE